MSQTQDTTPLQYKMYVMVPYQLKAGQIAAQSFHAGMMYAKNYFDSPEFKIYLEQHTVVILDGGTTNKKSGMLNQTLKTLQDAGIDVAFFHEPDLEDALSAICFLADERVFNKVDYSYEDRTKPTRTAESLLPHELEEVGGYQNAVKRLATRYKSLAQG